MIIVHLLSEILVQTYAELKHLRTTPCHFHSFSLRSQFPSFLGLHHLAVLLIQPSSSSYIGEVSIFIFTASAGSNQATHIDFAWLRPVSCNEFISPKFQKLRKIQHHHVSIFGFGPKFGTPWSRSAHWP